MKRYLLYLVGGLIILGLVMQLTPYGRDHTNPAVNDQPQWDSPVTRALAKRACYDCHSNQTVWPWYSNIAPVSWLVYHDVIEGRMHINFSDWNRPDEQHVDEFQMVLDQNSMPPKNYVLLHPAARLTQKKSKNYLPVWQNWLKVIDK